MNISGRAELVQVVELIDEDRPTLYLIDAKCVSTGRQFSDGYHPIARDLKDIKGVFCTGCGIWHELVVRKPIRRRMVTADEVSRRPRPGA